MEDSNDDVTLTSFRPISPENSRTGFSLARFFQRKRHDARVEGKVNAAKSQRLASPLTSPRSSPKLQKRTKSPEPLYRSWSSALPLVGHRTSAHSTSVPARRVSPGYRNVHAVLGRLNAAAGERGQLRQEYKESDFKQYWMPDDHCKECYECGEKFNTFRRRHHCRLCGQIFCYRCCYLEIPGVIMGYNGFLRVCIYCHNVVHHYTQSSDLNAVRNLEQLQADVGAISSDPDLSASNSSNMNLNVPKGYPFDFDDDENFCGPPTLRKISSSSGTGMSSYYEKLEPKDRPSPMPGRRPFDAFGVCAAEADMLKQDSFRELWNQIMSPRSGLDLQSHRFRLRTYQNCFVGSELVDWFLMHEKASTRQQAVMIGQGLLESGWLEPVPNTRDGGAVFKDEYILYQPGVAAAREISTKRPSLFWSDSDKSGDKNEPLNESDEIQNIPENVDDDNDEMVPHWFRQLEQQGVESAIEEFDTSFSLEAPGKLNNHKTGPKVLDLDLMNGVAAEGGNSEMSLKVDLHHFGEPGKLSTTSPDTSGEAKASQLSLITDVPPPPLEQYVYNEGYPYTPLRPSNKKNQEELVLSTSNTPDEIFSGAMIARKIGVDRPPEPELGELREDNGERLAMERLRTSHAYHLNILLEQLLKDAGLSVDWKDTILPLVMRISEQVTPDVRRDDDMNICEYVKFKKIPGGNKSDCEMISGVVFTKNIANKKMASMLSNPKILVLRCAIDYQRNENRLASLDPLVLQESEFLKNFVARVLSLRPNILLVEKSVSRLAQENLLERGITLVLNVKPNVIERIARCTRADVLRSMEQLSRPQLGTCQSFRVQRYSLKHGESKTLMFIEGCPADLGCTVNLRGGNSFALAKVKRIFRHMVYVAYSLRLEQHFLMDEFAMPPDTSHLLEEWEMANRNFEKRFKVGENEVDGKEDCKESCSEQNKNLPKASQQDTVEGSDLFMTALKSTVLSSSPFLDYPIPYLLTEAGRNMALRSTLPPDIYWSSRLTLDHTSRPLTEEGLEEFDFSKHPHQRCLSKRVCKLEPHPLLSATLTMEAGGMVFQTLLSDFRAQGGQIHLTKNGMSVRRSQSKVLEHFTKKTPIEKNTEQGKIQGGYREGKGKAHGKTVELKEKKDPFVPTSPLHFNRKHMDCLDPYFHQRIAVLFISYSNESNNSPRPCISPWAVFMEFYGRNDITLGGFLEIYCFRPSYICPNPNCDIPMVDHVRYFAHGTGSVYIHMRNLESPIPGFQHTILTWSWCKECKQVTPIVPLSPEAWALSFAKYLELRFYAGNYKRRASVEPCGHSLHKDHYQYFAYANMVASFKYRPIKLLEIAIPSPQIFIQEKTRDASFWISDLRAMTTKGDTVFAAISDRLESLKDYPIILPERQARIQQLFKILNDEHKRFLEQIEIVEKKAASLQELDNPLATEDVSTCENLAPEDRLALEYVIANSLNSLKKTLCEAVESWNNTLQEYAQAEKKKNIKSVTSSYKEGKLLSSMQSDAKSVSEQLSKSTDLIRASDISVPDGNLSPALTPWGSRSPSPHPNPEINEDEPLVLNKTDLEVLHATTGFRPIQYPENETCTPGDSPTAGILPVGGVVKGHSTPEAKKETLARVGLDKDVSRIERPADSIKAFVAVAPKREEPEISDRSNSGEVEGAAAILENPTKNSSEVKMAGQENVRVDAMNIRPEKDPSGVNVGGIEWPVDVEVEESKGENLEVETYGAKEPDDSKTEVAKGPSSDNMVDANDPFGDEMDAETFKGACTENSGGEQGRCEGPLKVENELHLKGNRTSFWYIVEKETENGEICNSSYDGKQNVSHEQSLTSLEEESEAQGTETQTLKTTFVRGHRRVASSPPFIAVLSKENEVVPEGKSTSAVNCVERSRSDSDLSSHAKKDPNESVLSSNSENLVEDETDAGWRGKGDRTAKKKEANDSCGERNTHEVSKVIPSAFNKKSLYRAQSVGATNQGGSPKKGVVRSQSWAVNQWQVTAKKALVSEGGDPDATPATDASVGTSKREKVKNIISSFMSGSAFQPVPSTFPSHEHHLLPPGEKVLVVVSEKETSSIIAYTLSTKEYNERLLQIQQTLSEIKNGAAREHLQGKGDVIKTGDLSVKSQSHLGSHCGTQTYIRVDSGPDGGEGYVHLDIVNPETGLAVGEEGETPSVAKEKLEFMSKSQEFHAEPEPQATQHAKHRKVERVVFTKGKNNAPCPKDDAKKVENNAPPDIPAQDDIGLLQFGFQRKDANPAVDFHVKHQFADSTCRFYCSIYYAEQFRSLRKRIFPDGEEKYIRSLQHSVSWGARGGKSGSAFFKSFDDRFVMKQMSRLELQCFLEFAPHYFCYINKALDEQRPTLLAKILGIYRIGYKNSQTGATMRQDVLVMENLFYDRKIDKTFDLKGSMRSRYVQTSGMKNDVLLDENLLEMIRECPIFIRPHSKAILSRAIHNDTEFLAQQMVMDYSLLVGIDEARSELVTGIIDFIRTFTWDKKLEMYVKASGILGGQGRMPTVVSPELYRTRFTEAMHRYFLMVPDKWTGLGSDLD